MMTCKRMPSDRLIVFFNPKQQAIPATECDKYMFYVMACKLSNIGWHFKVKLPGEQSLGMFLTFEGAFSAAFDHMLEKLRANATVLTMANGQSIDPGPKQKENNND